MILLVYQRPGEFAASFFFPVRLQIVRKWRADERTRTADVISLRVTIGALRAS
jgi:hypothetical protein